MAGSSLGTMSFDLNVRDLASRSIDKLNDNLRETEKKATGTEKAVGSIGAAYAKNTRAMNTALKSLDNRMAQLMSQYARLHSMHFDTSGVIKLKDELDKAYRSLEKMASLKSFGNKDRTLAIQTITDRYLRTSKDSSLFLPKDVIPKEFLNIREKLQKAFSSIISDGLGDDIKRRILPLLREAGQIKSIMDKAIAGGAELRGKQAERYNKFMENARSGLNAYNDRINQRALEDKEANRELAKYEANLIKVRQKLEELRDIRDKFMGAYKIQRKAGFDNQDLRNRIAALDAYIAKVRDLQNQPFTVVNNPSLFGNLAVEQSQLVRNLRQSTKQGDDYISMLRRAQAEQTKLTRELYKTKNAANSLFGSFSDLKGLLMSGMSMFGIQQLFNSIIQTGGEIEKQHIGLQSIIGDLQQANGIFGEIKNLALESPFTFGQITSYTKQLAAFGVETDELMNTTKRLSDIASGVGVDMQRIAYAYGQVKSRAYLDGKELRQFAYAGIPLLQKLADYYAQIEGRSISTSDVRNRITNREVSFDDVKKVLFDMTNEGGKFYEMQSVLSETLLGRYNKLKDAWEIMLAGFASTDSVVGGTLKSLLNMSATFLLNIQKIIAAVGALGAAFLSVKAIGVVRNWFSGGITNLVNNKQQQAALIAQKSIFAKISDQEREVLFTKRSITAQQIRQLGIDGKITRNMAMQLVLDKRLSHGRSVLLMKTLGINKYLQMSLFYTQRMLHSGNQLKMVWGTFLRTVIQGTAALGGGLLKMFGGWQGLALTAGMMGAMQMWSNHEQLKSDNKQTAEEIRDRYKSLQEFIENHPIEPTITNGTAMDKINALKDNYEELSKFNTSGKAKFLSDLSKAGSIDEQLRIIEKYRKEMALLVRDSEQYSSVMNDAFNDADGVLSDSVETNIQEASRAFGQMSNIFSRATESEVREYIGGFGKYSSELKAVLDQTFDEMLREKPSTAPSRMLEYMMQNGMMFSANSSNNMVVAKAAHEYKSRMLDLKSQLEDIAKYVQKNINLQTPDGRSMYEMLLDEMFDKKSVPANMRGGIAMYLDQLLGFDNLPSAANAFAERIKDEVPSAIAEKLKNDETLTDAENEIIKKLLNNAGSMFERQFPDTGDNIQRVLSSRDFFINVTALLKGVSTNDNEWQKRWKGIAPSFASEIKSSTSMADVISSLQKRYKDAVEANERILLNLQKKFPSARRDSAGKYSSMLERSNPEILEYNRNQEVINQGKELERLEGIDVTGKIDKKEDSARERARREAEKAERERIKNFRNLFDLIKSLNSEYEKWEKLLGKDAANKKLREIGDYAELIKAGIIDENFDASDRKTNSARWKEYAEKNIGLSTEDRKKLVQDSRKFALDEAREVDVLTAESEVNKKIRAFEKELQAQERFNRGRAAYGREFGSRYMYGAEFGSYLSKNRFGSSVNGDITKDIQQLADVVVKGTQRSAKEFKDILAQRIINFEGNDERKTAEELLNDEKYVNSHFDGNRELLKKMLAEWEKLDNQEIEDLLSEVISITDSLHSQTAEMARIDAKAAESIRKLGGDKADPALKKIIKDNADIAKNRATESYKMFMSGNRHLNAEIGEIEYESAIADLNTELANGTKSLEEYYDAYKKAFDARYMSNLMPTDMRSRKDDLLQSAAFNRYMFNLTGDEKYKTQENNDIERAKVLAELYTTLSNLSTIFEALGKIMQPVVDLFDSLGMEGAGGALNAMQSALGAGTGVADGLASLGLDKAGPYGAAAGAALSLTSSIIKQHDAQLEKEIEASKQRQKEMQWFYNAIKESLEASMGGMYNTREAESLIRDMEQRYSVGKLNWIAFGNEMRSNDKSIYNNERLSQQTKQLFTDAKKSGSYYDAMLASLSAQRDEAKVQFADEDAKKNSDNDKLEEYRENIYEAEKAMADFAKEMAKDLYSIDFKSWAGQLSDALVEAWANGTNSVKAYKDAVSQMLKEVGASVIQQKYIEQLLEPTMNKFLNQFEADNGQITDEGWKILEELYDGAQDAADATNAYMNGIEQIAQAHGSTMRSASGSSLSSAIAGVTEDTADLLASYLNGIRSDVSIKRTMLQQLVEEQMPYVNNQLAMQLAEMKKIESNTYRNANAADGILEILNNATNGSGLRRFTIN